MEHYPAMNIHFPPVRERELHEEMKRRATPPWSLKETDSFDRPPTNGSYFFHRDRVDDQPSCTLCIHREKEGHWVVTNIVPDEFGQIPLDVYKTLLSEFDSMIAEPAAEDVEGITAMELSTYRLEDYFSPKVVGLVETFCATSNQTDRGSHPSDQEKRIRFLLAVYDEGKDIATSLVTA